VVSDTARRILFFQGTRTKKQHRSRGNEMKGHKGTSVFCAAILFCTILVSPAFAQMKKVDEAELALTNASVTGESVKNQGVAAEKGAAVQDSVTTGNLAKGESLLVPYDNSFESVGINLNIKGQESFTFRVDRFRSETTGGVTGVSSHR
jgi:hypothetical protein